MTEDLEQRFSKKALASRSDAYQWLSANRVEIAAVFARHGRPPWHALAQTAADEGKTFTPSSLRMAWKRLERDLAREAGQQTTPATAGEPSPVTPTPPTNPADPPSPTPAADGDDEEEITLRAGSGKTVTVRIPKK